VARAREELHPEPGAADALAGEGDRRRVEVRARRVDVRRVAAAELDVHRRGDADQLRDLVVADESADVVRRLDVDVERDVDRGPDRGDLREGQIGGQVDRVGAEVGEDAGGGRVRGGEHHRDLRLHV